MVSQTGSEDSMQSYAEQQVTVLTAKLVQEQARVKELEQEVHRLNSVHQRDLIEQAETQALYDRLRGSLGNVATAYLNFGKAWAQTDGANDQTLQDLWVQLRKAMYGQIEDTDYN